MLWVTNTTLLLMFRSLPFKYIFMRVIVFGTLFSLSSRHWLGIWAGLEINLIGFLPVLVYQKRILERESAVKYFVIQALGSRFLMFGRLINFDLSLSWENVMATPLFSVRNLFLLGAGLMLKIGVFPFHFWFPSVMVGLGWFSCFILATWQKVAPIFLIIALTRSMSRVLLIFTICILGAGSRIVGGLGGLNQTQIRALIAYSSIGHIGWILFGLCSRERAVKIYFFIYVRISFCIFISLWALDATNIKILGSLSNRESLGAFSFLFILLSLGGLPPLLGFISKWIIILTSVATPSRGILLLLILGSLIRLFYYLRLFFSEILSLKRDTFSTKYILKVGNHFYINTIILVNVLGGLVFLFVLPTSFV